MRARRGRGALLGLALGAGLPLAAACEPSAAELRALGAETFSAHCARCHGELTGEGPPIAPGGALPRDLTDPALQAARTDAQLAAFIARGKPPMPAFEGTLSATQVRAVIAHLRANRRR